jgi:hypothetical protein
MRFNNCPAEAKPHAGAVWFGCKELVEYLFRDIRRKNYPSRELLPACAASSFLVLFSYPKNLRPARS